MIYRVTGKEPKDIVDWVAVGRPEEIVIPDGHTEPVRFVGIQASKANPVLVSGGDITVPSNLSFGVKFDDCQYFEFYNTKIDGGNIGATFDKRTTNFELNALLVVRSGAVGILAKDDSALRGQFTMTCKIHDCVVKDPGTEGIYVGNSKWSEGKAHECGDVWIYENIISNSGWEGLQLGSTPKGARVFNNHVFNAGIKRASGQSNGIQIGEGTGGLCYGNQVKGTVGNGIIVLGIGNNLVFNNNLSECGESGIFADTRGVPLGRGFKIFGNTIDSPNVDGVRIYAKLPENVVTNNIIINPQGTYVYILKGVTGTFEPNFLIRE